VRKTGDNPLGSKNISISSWAASKSETSINAHFSISVGGFNELNYASG
jgi:hypothetical protein